MQRQILKYNNKRSVKTTAMSEVGRYDSIGLYIFNDGATGSWRADVPFW